MAHIEPNPRPATFRGSRVDRAVLATQFSWVMKKGPYWYFRLFTSLQKKLLKLNLNNDLLIIIINYNLYVFCISYGEHELNLSGLFYILLHYTEYS